MQRKLSECHLTMDNNVIRHHLMQGMPISTRSSLSAHLVLPPNIIGKLTVTNNVIKLNSTRNNLPAPPSHNPVLAVSFDLSHISDTTLRKILDQNSSIFGYTDFNTPCTHKFTHRVAVSTKPNFCTPRKFCPEKLYIAKLSFDQTQRLGIIGHRKTHMHYLCI